jgi:AraC-like DNA-binding protein
VRFRRALRSARRAVQHDWASIAESAGYYDQAHMIAEFRELTALTPSQLMSELSGATVERVS